MHLVSPTTNTLMTSVVSNLQACSAYSSCSLCRRTQLSNGGHHRSDACRAPPLTKRILFDFNLPYPAYAAEFCLQLYVLLQEFSMTGWRYLNVSKVIAEECVVRVTNLPETSSGGHKIKISSLLLSVGMETSSQTLYSDLSSKASTSTREPEAFTQKGSAVGVDRPAAPALSHRSVNFLFWAAVSAQK